MEQIDAIQASYFTYTAHLNFGKAGYGYAYRSVQFPRVMFIDRAYKSRGPNGKTERTWMVDGREAAWPGGVLEALAKPPELSDDEKRILDQIPTEFVDLRQLEDDLAGVPHPKGAIMPNTPHSRVNIWIGALRDKGMVELGKRAWTADYKPTMTIEHLRWSPTIRRVA